MSIVNLDEQKTSTTMVTLTNAVELAAGIAMEVLNQTFADSDQEVPTLSVVRDVAIERIKTNHNL